MTPDQAFHLAKFQRPGVILCVGAEQAKERQVTPLSYYLDLRKLPGDASWAERDFRLAIKEREKKND
jgi:hypothetical protein